jgi:hypothetical protein
MRKRIVLKVCIGVIALLPVADVLAIGRGGGGISRGGGGGFSRPSGGMSRPSGGFSRPSGGISRPSGGSFKPSGGLPSSRPSVSRPATPTRPSIGGSPSISRPSTRPSTSLPSVGNRPPTTSRPTTPTRPSRPQIGGGDFGAGRPSTSLPGGSGNRPTTLPGNVTRPSPGGDRPTTLPGVTRPGTRGDRPGIGGGDRPTTLPGVTRPGDRPGSGDRPGIGDRPGFGGDRPTTLPGNRPGIGDRPGAGNRPGIDRPSQGDLNDFLGIDRPTTLPANRPNFGNGSSFDRPVKPSRPINIGNQVNVGINKRPSWVNIDNNRINAIDKSWQSAINARPGGGYGMRDWQNRHPDRMARNRYWGNGVRNHYYGRYHNHFGRDWWSRHNRFPMCGWSYHYAFRRYGYSYWWTYPRTWAACSSWFAWNAPAAVWAEPVYYDYGTGGNVVIQDNSVYINQQEVASVEEYAQSAGALAAVPPPEDQAEAEDQEWMPLGTFAISTSDEDTDTHAEIQLAVSKEGILSGTYYDAKSDTPRAVQGSVDKETQRVAFRIEGSQAVIETGLYNLTQSEAPVMVHTADGKDVKYYMLVRLEQHDDLGD